MEKLYKFFPEWLIIMILVKYIFHAVSDYFDI
jgi:hypothetical protein